MPTMIENQIAESMRRLDYTASFLAGFTGLSQAKISQGLNGLRPFSGPEALQVLDSTKRLERLARLLDPVPVRWQNPVQIKELLDQLDRGLLKIAVVQNDEPVQRQKAFSIGNIRNQYFVNYQNNQPTTHLNFVCATAMVETLADEVISRLEALGYKGVTKQENTFKQEDACFEIDQVWS